MWTAVIAVHLLSPAAPRPMPRGQSTRSRRARRCGRSSSAIPFAYLAVPLLLTVLLVRGRLVVPRRAAGRDPPGAAGAHRDVRRRIRGARPLDPADDFLPRLDAGPAAGARRRCRSCWCTASAATPACGAAFAGVLSEAGSGRSTRSPTARRSHRSSTSPTRSRRRIGDIEAATGASQVVLVGHSMGGLVARAYLRRYGGAKVRRLITIGTPHQAACTRG